MMSKYILLIGMLSFMLLGCNSDSTNPTDGDSDASELELEAETDSGEIDITDTSTDGDESDADSEAVEDELPDGDDDLDAVEDELDSDLVDSDVAEAEEEIEIEQVVYPPTVIETLPYDELTVTACEQKTYDDNLPAASESNRLVWGDDDGLKYFVDRRFFDAPQIGLYNSGNFFWVYDEANKTFSCEKEMDSAVSAMDGINTDSGTVIWLAQKNRLAKRTPAGEWLYFDIPDAPMPYGYYIAGGIQVDASGWVAVWGRWGIVFYNESTDTWKKFDLPDFVEQPVVLYGSWNGNKFYLPVGCKVLSWEIGTDSLIEEATIDGCDESTGDALYVIDKTENDLEMAQANWKTYYSSYGALRRTVTLDLTTKVQKSLNLANPTTCNFHDCQEPVVLYVSYLQEKASLHILPGMFASYHFTIISTMGFATSISTATGRILHNSIRMGPDVYDESGKCACGKLWSMGSWYIPFNPGQPINDWESFASHMFRMLSTSFWWDGSTLWMGSTRVAQGAP